MVVETQEMNEKLVFDEKLFSYGMMLSVRRNNDFFETKQKKKKNISFTIIECIQNIGKKNVNHKQVSYLML